MPLLSAAAPLTLSAWADHPFNNAPAHLSFVAHAFSAGHLPRQAFHH
jgi:hypothetical protein